MSNNSEDKKFFENLVDVFNKLDKVFGLVLTLLGYLNFKEGNKFISYAFVIIGYVFFSYALIRVLRAKQEKVSTIFTPSQDRRMEYTYSGIQRSFAGIALIALTTFTFFWTGNNLLKDMHLNKDQGNLPSITVVSSTQVLTANAELENSKSSPRFALESLNSYTCLYGQDKNDSDLIWLVIGEKQNVKAGEYTYPVDKKTDFEFSSLLLVPEQVVLSEVNVQFNYLRTPPDEKDIQYVALLGCGQGGSPVFPLVFSKVELLPNNKATKLETETVSLPYQLNNGDTMDFHLPITAKTPGEYEIYFTAKVVLFSGEVVEIKSKSLHIGIINPDQILSKDIDVR